MRRSSSDWPVREADPAPPERSLELLYGAIVSFVTTTLLLAVAPWIGHTVVPSPVTAGIFILGIASLLLALVLEFSRCGLG